jgi:aspartate dehydrogenase
MGTNTKSNFCGSVREATVWFPKNANVAAAVALAGLGFDDTEVALGAGLIMVQNFHESRATGDLGNFRFRIVEKTLPVPPAVRRSPR